MQSGAPYDAKQNGLGLIVGMVRGQNVSSPKRLALPFEKRVARVARLLLVRQTTLGRSYSALEAPGRGPPANPERVGIALGAHSMVEMADHQFRGRQPGRELQKMEQSQGIHATGNAHQNTVARLEELPPYNVVREIERESEVRVQWSNAV